VKAPVHHWLRAQTKTFFADDIKSWLDAEKNALQSGVTVQKIDVIGF